MLKNKIYSALVITFFFFSYLSCTDKISKNIIGPDGGTITSEDGKIMLKIPQGALDEEVEITLIRFEEEEKDSDLILFEFLPDGLEFKIPANLIVNLSDQLNFQGENEELNINQTPFILNINDEGDIDLLENLSLNTDDENSEVNISADLNHFSKYAAGGNLGIKGKIDRVPLSHPAFTDFFPLITITEENVLIALQEIEYQDYFSKLPVHFTDEDATAPNLASPLSLLLEPVPDIINTTQTYIVDYRCDSVGTGTYSARIVFEIVPGLRLNLSASFTDPEILILSNFSSNNVNGNTEIKINNPDILKLSASRRVECFESFLGDVDDDPIGDPGGEGGDDAIDGGGTAGEPDNCSATGCSDIIGDYISSGFVISDLFGEQAFVNNLCNSITVEDDEMENDVIINNGANIPVWATTIFNPTDCTCRATGSGTGSAAGFNNVLVEMDLSFNLQNGTFEGEASYNGSTGSQFPAVGYMCDGKKIMFEN